MNNLWTEFHPTSNGKWKNLIHCFLENLTPEFRPEILRWQQNCMISTRNVDRRQITDSRIRLSIFHRLRISSSCCGQRRECHYDRSISWIHSSPTSILSQEFHHFDMHHRVWIYLRNGFHRFACSDHGGLGMVALFWGRQLDIRRSLIIAFVGMLIYNPYYLVYDVGFLFSFSAIIGIIYFGKIWEIPKKSDKKNIPKFLAKIQLWFAYVRSNYLSPSIWATLGILPTMIFFMGRINLLSVIGNLFVLPIVPFVMIYGFISTVLYQIFPRPGILQIEERLIRYIYRVSEKSWEFWLYMNVEGDRIKYLILGAAILWLVRRRLKDWKREENTPLQEMEKTKVKSHELCDS